MQGQFEVSGKQYEWWAGPASQDADEDYCVHCRQGDWGVTQYVPAKPSESEAAETARQLAPHVDALQG